MHALTQSLLDTELVTRSGHVVAVRGQLVESTGPAAQLGEQCRIESARSGHSLEAEVVGFDRGATLLMPFDSLQGVSVGDRVVALGRLTQVGVGAQLLGRVVDAFGRPVDEGTEFTSMEQRALHGRPPAAMGRNRVAEPLASGVRVIDTMMAMARGQRIGLFAGSGVGKSSLMGMMARGTQAGIVVVALIGERSREVREFVEDQLGADGLRRAVVVVATANEPAVVRVKAAYTATTIAEYFRDQGEEVLLLMDSVTRLAMARREVGLAIGEPPTARGYTPSVFSELPQLCERSGPGRGAGSITSLYTVLVEGDDMNDPVADTLRATLDGHIVLSRDLANEGQFPAIDVLKSLSRVHSTVSREADLAAARKVLALCALYERNRQLIEIGAYKPGVSAELDLAVRHMPRIRQFFAQPVNETLERGSSLRQLRELTTTIGDDV